MRLLFALVLSLFWSLPVGSEESLRAPDEAALRARMEAAIRRHGGEAFRRLWQQGFRYKAEMTGYRGGKSYAQITLYRKGDRSRIELQRGGETEIQGFDGQTGWRKQGFLVTRLAQEENEEQQDALLQDFFAIPRLLETCRPESSQETKLPDGRNAFRITFKIPGKSGSEPLKREDSIACYLNEENQIIGLEYVTLDRETYERSRVVEVYHNFRQQGEVWIPYEQHFYVDGTHTATLHILELDPTAKIAETLFERPPSDEPPIVREKLPATVPFVMEHFSLYLQVSINGSQPYWLIFDTGAARSWIDSKVAEEVGLGPKEKIEGSEHLLVLVYGLVQAYGAKAKSVRIGNAEIKDVVFSVGPLEGTPLAGEKIEGKPVIGLLGREVISAFQTTLHFAERTLTFEAPNAPLLAGTVIPFELYGDHILVTTRVSDKQDVRLIVDTGAAANIMPPAFEMQPALGKSMSLGEWYKRMGEFLPKDAYTFETEEMRVLRLHSMSLGSLRFEPVFAFQKLAEHARPGTIFGSKTTHGLLGIPIMRHYKITFNYFREQMVWQPLTATERGADNGGYGIWWRKQPRGLVVEWVMPLSDADLAGLRKGDRIVTIDGVPAARFTENQLVNRLSYTTPGRKVHLIVERNGKRLPFTLTARTYEL